MKPRSELGAVELLREVGAVLRMSEAEAAALSGQQVDPTDDETMIINMGPQHPCTHGVLRLMLELAGRDGAARASRSSATSTPAWRRRARSSPTSRAPPTSPAWTTLSPLFNELVFSLAAEKLLEIEAPRAGHVDPHAHDRAEPDRVAPAVPGHQRHGHRRGVDDALRLARAGGGAALLPEGHRPADEPQLHPARRRRRRPARRLARRRAAPPRR